MFRDLASGKAPARDTQFASAPAKGLIASLLRLHLKAHDKDGFQGAERIQGAAPQLFRVSLRRICGESKAAYGGVPRWAGGKEKIKKINKNIHRKMNKNNTNKTRTRTITIT